MTRLAYEIRENTAPRLGLLVLQADETIEDEARALMPGGLRLLVSRVPSDLTVTADTLAAMEGRLTEAAGRFPHGVRFDAIGYGCTSATAQIGAETVAARIKDGASAAAVTNPMTALVAACRSMGLKRLAFLSPYVEEVSGRLRDVLAEEGVHTPVFGSFDEAEEARVARIAAPSLIAAGAKLARGAEVDGLFLSCTNLRTLDVIAPLQSQIGMPVLSSNLVLFWHMLALAGMGPATPSDLLTRRDRSSMR